MRNLCHLLVFKKVKKIFQNLLTRKLGNDIISVPHMPKAYIIARSAISYRRYITRSARNGYHNFVNKSRRSLVSLMMHRLWRYDVFRFAQNDVAPLRFAMMRCLPQNVAKPRIIREANIIRRSRHHLPKANIIQKSLICLVDKSGFFAGCGEGI